MANQDDGTKGTYQPVRLSLGAWIAIGVDFGVPLGLVFTNLAFRAQDLKLNLWL
jgi:hypothetical protein